jgi:uncharacterized protein (DUF433 family)
VVVEYPSSPYIYQLNRSLYVAGSAVSLDSVVIHYQEGASPAQIVESFPTLQLWQVYGALAYYLQHEQLIGEYVTEGEREFEIARAESRKDPRSAALWERLEKARQEMLSKHT